jgi:hypothetical protein
MTVSWHSEAVISAVRGAAQAGVKEGSDLVHKEAVRLLTTGGRSGRKYRRRGVVHQASAPGEPPKSDTGRLAQSGNVTIIGGGLVGRVAFGTVYARPLEKGSAYTISSSRGVDQKAAQREFGTQTLEPRPFLRPALQNVRGVIATLVIQKVAEALKPFTFGPAAQGNLF